MICPNCTKRLSLFSMEKIQCKECGSRLKSVNGKKVNIILIITWAFTGRLIVFSAFDSLAAVLLVTLFVGGPIFLILRAGFVEYKIDEEDQPAL